MSAAEFQKRIADLIFSAQEHLKELRQEMDDSEEKYADWENRDTVGEEHDEDEEPEVIDHTIKIAHIETAIGHLEAADDELYCAIAADTEPQK